MPELNKQQLLSAFMDGQLTQDQRQEFEALCLDDPEFAAEVEWANRLTLQAQDYQQTPVPNWDRSATFSGAESRKWWQWQSMPALSMAFSIAAMVMVITGFQIKVDDGSMTISFSQQTSSKEVEKLVQARLQEFKTNQAQALASYAQNLQQQQLDASTQLTNYLIASSRKERREDFGEFIKFINQQRSEDQIFYARQLNRLQEDIYSNTDTPWEPVAPMNLENQ